MLKNVNVTLWIIRNIITLFLHFLYYFHKLFKNNIIDYSNMGNFCSFLKKKINNESINTNNNNSPFLKNMDDVKNSDAKIDIYLDEDDNKNLPAYSQV
jgi:hypothetical protein